MLVKELAEILLDLPPDAPVMIEGCDCSNGVGEVKLEKWEVLAIKEDRDPNVGKAYVHISKGPFEFFD